MTNLKKEMTLSEFSDVENGTQIKKNLQEMVKTDRFYSVRHMKNGFYKVSYATFLGGNGNAVIECDAEAHSEEKEFEGDIEMIYEEFSFHLPMNR